MFKLSHDCFSLVEGVDHLSSKCYTPGGGGSDKKGSSMLEKNSVWNGGSKMEKLCGIVWTQNGVEFVRVGVIWV